MRRLRKGFVAKAAACVAAVVIVFAIIGGISFASGEGNEPFLGDYIEYGIICNYLNQTADMETNFVAGKYSGNGQYTGNTVSDNKANAPGEIRIGEVICANGEKGTAADVKVHTAGGSVYVDESVKKEAADFLEKVYKYSKSLLDKSNFDSPKVTDMNNYIIDISNKDDKTVYVNADQMVEDLTAGRIQPGGLKIRLREAQTIVLNIREDNKKFSIPRYTLTVTDGKKTKDMIAQNVIWNMPDLNNLAIESDNMAATVIAPRAFVNINTTGEGWLVCDTVVSNPSEWHMIYQKVPDVKPTPEPPKKTPKPSAKPLPTKTPDPMRTPKPEKTAEPTATPKPQETEPPTPNETEDPVKPAPTPKETPEPERTAAPTATPKPQETEPPTPNETEDPVKPAPTPKETPEPARTPKPTATPVPTQTTAPTATPKPETSHRPTAKPTGTPKPTLTPAPDVTPKPGSTATPEPAVTETPKPEETGDPLIPTGTPGTEPTGTPEALPGETPPAGSTGEPEATPGEFPVETPGDPGDGYVPTPTPGDPGNGDGNTADNPPSADPGGTTKIEDNDTPTTSLEDPDVPRAKAVPSKSKITTIDDGEVPLAPGAPKTGDDTNLLIPLIIMGASALAIVFVLIYRKKRYE